MGWKGGGEVREGRVGRVGESERGGMGGYMDWISSKIYLVTGTNALGTLKCS